ncbi:hypothetical protein OIE68_20755 [Nocardia vinacea]|uniref:Uncharacterized protein n=1 Tax=Nocardia vinacea TaxID=96468 RepID=A0ABZ1Z1F6_9NOCA|nr:hypothetical protein OIE68_20755 [Nocardia vinacea]
MPGAHCDWPGRPSIGRGCAVCRDLAAICRETALLEAILLLADGPTVAAARTWQQKVWDLRALHADQSVSAEAVGLTLATASEARDRFYACARPDLGILTALPTPQPRHQENVLTS